MAISPVHLFRRPSLPPSAVLFSSPLFPPLLSPRTALCPVWQEEKGGGRKKERRKVGKKERREEKRREGGEGHGLLANTVIQCAQ